MKLNRILNLLVISCLVAVGAILPPRPAQAQDANACAADVTIQPGETLSLLAGRHLGSQLAYQAIVDATNARARVDSSYATVADPNRITAGWKLCIPASTAPQTAAPVPAPEAQPQAPAMEAAPVALPTPPALDLSLDEMHPLMVEYMRQQEYPGSDIAIEQVLEPGVNYNRYIASYRSDGFKIYALLTVPQGAKPATGWPVIIFNHGYIPPEVYRTTERYVAYVDAFARNGYIVFRSDYRGHGFSEGEATSSRGAPDYTIDVLNAVASMKRYADADPERIGMWGHSMGGLLTLRSMVTTQDVKAGVIWAGVVATYTELYERGRSSTVSGAQPFNPPWNNRRRWRDEIVEKWGTPQENPAIWAAISPNSYVGELSGPLQLHHGTADSSVPVEWSRTLNEQVRAAGSTVEYYEYAGDNHNISANLSTALARSVAFFDAYLK
jgi:uncharacterized protein